MPYTPEQGRLLLDLASAAIARRLGLTAPEPARLKWLDEDGASFVTLTRRGALRGCIGTLSAYRPLGEDVAENAQAAAFRDPRFPPLLAGEFADTRVEVSVLGAATPLPVTDEAEACAKLRPGIDGVILEHHGRRATFLPQVWEQLPDPALFLAQLKLKAGLPADFWAADLHVQRYPVEKFREGES